MKFFTTSKISENMHETPEGYLVCVGVSIARLGEMEYLASELLHEDGEPVLEAGPDGKVYVENVAEELFRPETMASFEGKDITIRHPAEFVDPQNHASLTKGILSQVRRGDGEQESDLVADLLVKDAEAIRRIKEGLREVSCGYNAEYYQTGVGRGMRRNIVGNHLALVEEGRAGSSYAINDQKGKGSPMKLKDRIKALFAKAQDEAVKMCADEFPDKKEEKKEAKDADPAEKKEEKKESKDADPAAAAPMSVEERLAKLEEMVASLMSTGSEDADEEEEAEADDASEEESEESEDSYGEEKKEEKKVGDAAASEEEEEEEDEELVSRVEILAPGMKAEGRDAKARAVKAAFATKDGKAAVYKFTRGKEPNLKDPVQVDTLFVGVSELLKISRTSDFAKTKTHDANYGEEANSSDEMTPEKINEANAKRYARK